MWRVQAVDECCCSWLVTLLLVLGVKNGRGAGGKEWVKMWGCGQRVCESRKRAWRRKGADLDAGFGAGQMLSAEHFLLDLLKGLPPALPCEGRGTLRKTFPQYSDSGVQ